MKGATSFTALSVGLLAVAPVLLGGSHVSANALAEAPVQDKAQKVNAWQDEMTPIASFSGQDRIASIHIHNLLQLHGIRAMSMGSLGYGLWVENDQVDRAKSILIDDATKNPYWLIVGEERFEREAGSIKTVKLNLRINDDGSIKLCPRNPYIERAVREVYVFNLFTAKSYEEHYAKPGGEYYLPRNWDFANHIEILKRRYLNSEGHWNVGYDFSLVLGSSTSQGAFNQLRGSVWDEGKGCQVWGSGGLRRPSDPGEGRSSQAASE